MANLNSEKNPTEEKFDEELPLTVQPERSGNSVIKSAKVPTKFGYSPVLIRCQYCNTQTKTNLAFHITDLSHCAVFICSVLTWPCGMCFLSGIPYCVPWFQKVDHHCSVCNAIVGKHSTFQKVN